MTPLNHGLFKDYYYYFKKKKKKSVVFQIQESVPYLSNYFTKMLGICPKNPRKKL